MVRKTYRTEGALLINEIFPEFNYDARVYDKADDFESSNYPLKRGERLMVRAAGGNDPGIRNPDRIVKSIEEAVEFMKRWENKDVGGFIVHRCPNESEIKYSASGIISYHTKPGYFSIDFRKIPPSFIKENMKTDTRRMTTRDFDILFNLEFDDFKSPPKKFLRISEDEFKSFKASIYKVWKFCMQFHNYLIQHYDKKDLKPTFLLYVLKNKNIFPIDIKRSYKVGV